MHVHYNARAKGAAVPNYVCVGRGRLFGDSSCQSILGTSIDAAIGTLLVNTITPVALELTLAVEREIGARLDEADQLRHRHVERAQYEADQAGHRYMQVDPANRLVADSLEADWNLKLRALDEAREHYLREHNADLCQLDERQRKRILELATDFPSVWSSPSTPHVERKRMLALIIDDVTLIKQRHITVAVRFRGGTSTTLTLPRPLTAQQLRVTHDDVRREIDSLMDEYTDAQVARILNERGRHTGAGDVFTPTSVKWVRHAAKLKSLKQRMLDDGWITGKQMCANLDVSRTTLGQRRQQGHVKGRICSDLGEWIYWPHPHDPPTPFNHQPVTSTARGAL